MAKSYSDIIQKNRPISKRHKMSSLERAAQFSPFAALTGYDDAIDETARYVDERIELDEESLNILDCSFQELRGCIDTKPILHLVYFVRDTKKNGGKYCSITSQIKKIDEDHHEFVMMDNLRVDMDDVILLEIEK